MSLFFYSMWWIKKKQKKGKTPQTNNKTQAPTTLFLLSFIKLNLWKSTVIFFRCLFPAHQSGDARLRNNNSCYLDIWLVFKWLQGKHDKVVQDFELKRGKKSETFYSGIHPILFNGISPLFSEWGNKMLGTLSLAWHIRFVPLNHHLE